MDSAVDSRSSKIRSVDVCDGTTGENFTDSEIKIRWGEWHQFFFKLKPLAKANSDTTFMNPFGMPAADARMLRALTPTLCTVRTHDESGNKKNYD